MPRALTLSVGIITSLIGLTGMIGTLVRMSEGKGGGGALVACALLSLVGAGVIWGGR